MTDVVIVESEALIVAEVDVVMVIAAGDQGPGGPPGPTGASGGDVLTLAATMATGGHRVIASIDENIVYADPSLLATAASIIGLTLNAAATGDDLDVVLRGNASDSGWSWMPGEPIYLGANGVLTQSVPSAGYILRLGHALSATEIIFNPTPPIITA